MIMRWLPVHIGFGSFSLRRDLVSILTQQVDLRNGEQFTPAFKDLNPACTVLVLELDDGATITDILSICRYLEEMHPDPPDGTDS